METQRPDMGRLWWSSFFWAIPLYLLVCMIFVEGAVMLGSVFDDVDQSASDYAAMAVVAPLTIGIVVFVFTCWFMVPVIAAVATSIRAARAQHRR